MKKKTYGDDTWVIAKPKSEAVIYPRNRSEIKYGIPTWISRRRPRQNNFICAVNRCYHLPITFSSLLLPGSSSISSALPPTPPSTSSTPTPFSLFFSYFFFFPSRLIIAGSPSDKSSPNPHVIMTRN